MYISIYIPATSSNDANMIHIGEVNLCSSKLWNPDVLGIALRWYDSLIQVFFVSTAKFGSGDLFRY